MSRFRPLTLLLIGITGAGAVDPASAAAPAVVVQQAGQGVIAGRVTDAATGQPLAAVQLRVVGTELGARTGADGAFRIVGVPAGARQLEVTRLGYTAQTRAVQVGGGATVTANVELATQAVVLEEIVAVGYGTQRKRDVTGSVASVSQTRLEQLPNTNVAQAIQGAAPGVSISTVSTGAEPRFNILIRGQNSITASNDPLIVVDGIPYNGNLAEINQSDVASIDILKDASSTAIYGARGANGVILVTTRKGRIGTPTVRYEGYVGTSEATNLPRLMTGPEFGAWKCEFLAPTPCDRALTPTERRMLDSGQWTNWYDLVLRNGSQQQHNLSLSGGNESTRYYLSGGALNTEGIAINDDFARYTIRANLDQKIGDHLDAGFSTQLSQADRSGRPASLSGAFDAIPLMPAFDENGVALITPWVDDPQRSNPLDLLNIVDSDLSRRTLANGYAELRAPFLEGLSYRFNGGVDFQSRDRGSYWGRNTRSGLSSQGRAVTIADRTFDWTVENILRYRRDVGAHTFDLTGLYGAQATNYENSELAAEGFPNDVLTYRQPHVARSLSPTTGVRESGLVSQMGRINYGYDGRYLVTLTARRDGYSGFGANYKYGVFPSLALAWNASEEPFWNFEDFNTLKLRLSYGQNGNQAINPYQTLARLSEYSYYDGGTWPGFRPATLGNPNLRWETTTSLNVGADFGLLGERVRGSLDLYTADTDDLLLERLISPVHGIATMIENVGAVRNEGAELALSFIPLETSNFSWTSDFNISGNRNRVIDLYGNGEDDLANQWFIGQSITTQFGWEFAGVWQQGDDIRNSAQPNAQPGDARVRDVNGDGKIDVNDRTFLGDEDPDFTIGFGNTFRYGAFTLNAFIHAVQGVTLYAYDLLGWPEDARSNALYFDWWRPENPITTRWANRQSANPYEVGLREDASFIRLRDVMLSYDIPGSISGRVGASGLRIFANGRNLWTHTDWRLMDPEIVPGPGANRPPPPGSPAALTGGAAHQRMAPMERIFSIGVNASF